jgi:hypothetical protein
MTDNQTRQKVQNKVNEKYTKNGISDMRTKVTINDEELVVGFLVRERVYS